MTDNNIAVVLFVDFLRKCFKQSPLLSSGCHKDKLKDQSLKSYKFHLVTCVRKLHFS